MRKPNKNRTIRRAGALVFLLALMAAVPPALHFLQPDQPRRPERAGEPSRIVPPTAPTRREREKERKAPPAPPGPVIDYHRLETGGPLDDLMDRRKADLGIGESFDMVVRPDESIKVGDATVPMREILEKIRIRRGGIVEESLNPEEGPAEMGDDLYGIHVVRPGDNIWNIHFGFLKAYFAGRGIILSPAEDEPDQRGASSGVGKILKFSENMVFIYNIREHRLEPDLNLIHPLSKIVVFHLERVLFALRLIDYEDIDRITYDGEVLWIPSAAR